MDRLGIHGRGGVHAERVVVPGRAVRQRGGADGVAAGREVGGDEPVPQQPDLQEDGLQRVVEFLPHGRLAVGRDGGRQLGERRAQRFEVALQHRVELRGQVLHGGLGRHAPFGHAHLHEFLRVLHHLRHRAQALQVVAAVLLGAERHAVRHLRDVLLRPAAPAHRHEERAEPVALLRLAQLPRQELPAQEVVAREEGRVDRQEVRQEDRPLCASLLDAADRGIGDAVRAGREAAVGDGVLGPFGVAPALDLVDRGQPAGTGLGIRGGARRLRVGGGRECQHDGKEGAEHDGQGTKSSRCVRARPANRHPPTGRVSRGWHTLAAHGYASRPSPWPFARPGRCIHVVAAPRA